MHVLNDCNHTHAQGTEVFGGLEIDTTGHGTAVAGCAISNTYGVAREATAIAVGIGFLKNPTAA